MEQEQHDDARLDPIVEDTIRQGFKVVEVPEPLQRQLKDNELEVFSHIKLTSLNPGKRRKITEVVQRAYHRDLQDKDLLSNKQVEKLVAERGEWGPEQERRLAELRELTTVKLASLYYEGVRQSTEWIAELARLIDKFETLTAASELSDDDKLRVKSRFTRWRLYHPDRQPEYAAAHAEDFPEGVYYPDRDFSWLLDHAPTLEAADALEDIHELREKVNHYLQLVRDREEFDNLRYERLRIFANTVETRRDNAEEMARAFFTTARCDGAGKVQGPITKAFEGMYDLPDEMIAWLVEEQFYFHNKIPDEMRQYAEALENGGSFPEAEPEEADPVPPTPTGTSAGSSEASAASPEAPSASTASPPSGATPSGSSA